MQSGEDSATADISMGDPRAALPGLLAGPTRNVRCSTAGSSLGQWQMARLYVPMVKRHLTHDGLAVFLKLDEHAAGAVLTG